MNPEPSNRQVGLEFMEDKMEVCVLIMNFSNGQQGVGCYGSKELALDVIDGVKKMGEQFEIDDFSTHEVDLITKLPETS